MVDKVKLGLWDFFAYVLSGAVVIFSVITHCLCKGIIQWKYLQEMPSAISAILSLLGVLLVGLMIEPVSNIYEKIIPILMTLCKGKVWNKRVLSELKSNWSNLEFSNWDKEIDKRKQEAQKSIENNFIGNPFQFCKNWVLQYGNSEQFQSSLAKFGFYRNLSFIAIINAISCLFLYSIIWNGIIAAIAILFLGILYFYRSKVFYRHMSVSVYDQFIIGYKVQTKRSSQE